MFREQFFPLQSVFRSIWEYSNNLHLKMASKFNAPMLTNFKEKIRVWLGVRRKSSKFWLLCWKAVVNKGCLTRLTMLNGPLLRYRDLNSRQIKSNARDNVANQRGRIYQFVSNRRIYPGDNRLEPRPYERVNENFMQVHPILFTVFLINLSEARKGRRVGLIYRGNEKFPR